MPKFKPESASQGIFTPVHLSHQIQEGIFEYTLLVYLTMLLYILPAVASFAAGKNLLDLSPAGYSYE